MARFVIYAVPRSARPGPDGRYNGLPRLRLKAPPTDGKANAEAERGLSDLLGSRVSLVAGASSRRKIFDVDLKDAVLTKRLRELFD